ncbi:DnaJ domain-containing protein [Ralstonia soli]|uniref:J domain-containing protein n=1 Tax=Ralstonia soli TaxID=2953896 RepID=A0ABT1AUB0_9RALS|nr:DnaJ domain-containing protein [Ralstonia soli]MCO5401764.1 J domain-containing protein [Ralstonia soli]
MSNKDPKGYYAILGVAPDAEAGEIKATYRRRAMELHPDRNKAANATEQFQLLNEAYGVLSDPIARVLARS